MQSHLWSVCQEGKRHSNKSKQNQIKTRWIDFSKHLQQISELCLLFDWERKFFESWTRHENGNCQVSTPLRLGLNSNNNSLNLVLHEETNTTNSHRFKGDKIFLFSFRFALLFSIRACAPYLMEGRAATENASDRQEWFKTVGPFPTFFYFLSLSLLPGSLTPPPPPPSSSSSPTFSFFFLSLLFYFTSLSFLPYIRILRQRPEPLCCLFSYLLVCCAVDILCQREVGGG